MKVRNIITEEIPRGREEAINKTYGETAAEREREASREKKHAPTHFRFPGKRRRKTESGPTTQQRIFVPLLLLLLLSFGAAFIRGIRSRNAGKRERERETDKKWRLDFSSRPRFLLPQFCLRQSLVPVFFIYTAKLESSPVFFFFSTHFSGSVRGKKGEILHPA